ncbi:hypothetical protein [Streptomyces sp. NPDC055036]
MDRTPEQADGAPLTAEEYEAVQAAVSAGAGRRAGGQPYALNSLLEEWSAFVSELGEGYSWCAPEFANDIFCRCALARVWPLLPPRVRSSRQTELDGIDGRFREATVSWPVRDADEGDWWRWRIPRRLEAEAGDPCNQGWPSGWDVMSFPKPDSVQVIS